MHSNEIMLEDYNEGVLYPDSALINYYGMPSTDNKRWEVKGLKYVRNLEVNFVLPMGEI